MVRMTDTIESLQSSLHAMTEQRDGLLRAAIEASDLLAEVYAKYSLKIGPFSTQCQRVNGVLRPAIAATQKDKDDEDN